MSVITISRGSFSKGREIAEAVAEQMGYGCISRGVLLKASKHFDVPELKLERALHDAPSILDRFSKGKERYVSYMRAAVLYQLKKDDMVYHGLAGHFFVKDVPHVMKVRVIADFDDRVAQEMARQEVGRDEAEGQIERDDRERRRWGTHLYGIDTNDPRLYDLVVHIHNLKVPDAVDVICSTVRKECFRTTEESQRLIEDLFIEAEVQVILLETGTDLAVAVKEGRVKLSAPDGKPPRDLEVKERIQKVEGVREVVVSDVPPPDYTNPWHNV